jgi:hypothetical protein
VLLADIQGRPVADVLAELTSKGLIADAVPGETVPVDDPRTLTVYDASPLGNVPSGSHIQVFYYVAEGTDASPTPTPTQ